MKQNKYCIMCQYAEYIPERFYGDYYRCIFTKSSITTPDIDQRDILDWYMYKSAFRKQGSYVDRLMDQCEDTGIYYRKRRYKSIC